MKVWRVEWGVMFAVIPAAFTRRSTSFQIAFSERGFCPFCIPYIDQIFQLGADRANPISLSGYIAVGTYSLSGRLNFPNSSTTDLTRTATFQFRDPTSKQLLFTQNATLHSNGNYTLTNIPAGKYNVLIRAIGVLSKAILIDTTQGNVNAGAISLLGADINNDNSVDIGDFGILINNYNASGDN